MERRNITFAQCDSMDEVHKHIKRHEETIYAQNERIEKLETQLGVVEAILGKLSRDVKKLLSPKPKAKPEPKVKPKAKGRKKGFVSMKALVGLVALLLFAASAFGANITYDQASNPQLLMTWINNNVNTGFYAFTPRTTAPSGADATEGAVYYNDDTDTFYGYVAGTTWTAFATASGNSLDEAYNTGVKIFVDGDVIELEVADGDNNSALFIDHDENTNYNPAFLIENASSDGGSVSIQIDGTGGYDIQGTSDSWDVSIAGLGRFASGVTIETAGELLVTARDVLFDDTYDVAWDTDQDMLIFQDNAELGLGGAHDGAADLTFKGDGTNVLIEVATEDAADLLIGYTNALDVKFHAATNTSFMIWDQSAAETIFDAADLRLNDDDQMFFGDGATDSFSLDFDEVTDNLVIVATTAEDAVQIGDGTTNTDFKLLTSHTDTAAFTWFDASGDTNNGQMKFGVDDHGQDVLFYGATASQLVWWDQSLDTWYFGADAEGVDIIIYADTTTDTVTFDESDEALEFVGVQLHMDDDSPIQLGTTAGDVVLQFNGTNLILDASTASEGWLIGDTSTGFDMTYYFETAGTVAYSYTGDTVTFSDQMALVFGSNADASIIYDETTDDNLEILAASVGMSITTNDFIATLDGAAANQFKVDATGVHAGNVIVFETTDGGILLDADGGDKGDIAIDSADDMTITVGGDLVFAVTGAITLPDDVIRKTTVAVTAVQADNLRATPKELVAAEAGKIHEFVKVIVVLDWGSVAYTESDDNFAVRYTNTTGVIVSDVIEATGLADATEDTICFAGPAPTTSALVTEAASTNKGLFLHGTGTSEWGNNGDSPLVVITYYRTHTVAELGID